MILLATQMKFESGDIMKLKEWAMAFGAGIVVGAIFTVFGFPLPAPPTIGGVMGILGVFLGSILLKA